MAATVSLVKSADVTLKKRIGSKSALRNRMVMKRYENMDY